MTEQKRYRWRAFYNAVAAKVPGVDSFPDDRGFVRRKLSREASEIGGKKYDYIYYRPSCDAAASERLWKCLTWQNVDYAGIIAALKDGADPHAYLTGGGVNGARSAFMTQLAMYVGYSKGDEHIGDIKTILTLAVKNGFDINAANDRDWPLLHSGRFSYYPEILKHCLKLGANPNIRSYEEHTPLFDGSSPERIFILLDHGADITLRSNLKLPAMGSWRDEEVRRIVEYGLTHDRLPQVIHMRELALAERMHSKYSASYKIWDDIDLTPYIRSHAKPKASAVSRYLNTLSDPAINR